MPNPRLAARYAKSLIDLATEKGQIENVYADMEYLQALTRQSREFANLLRSPIIKADKKISIVQAVAGNKISALTSSFLNLLINKRREEDLPEIIEAYIQQYDVIKGINKVKLVTASPASEELKQLVKAKLQAEAGMQTVTLETHVDESLIGGFILEYNSNLVDASIRRDLNDLKKQFSQNVYVPNIR
jgi:F-type H+-transporting ATPase subunit delta